MNNEKKLSKKLQKLDDWLCSKIEDIAIPNEERIIYSKVLDYLEQNIY